MPDALMAGHSHHPAARRPLSLQTWWRPRRNWIVYQSTNHDVLWCYEIDVGEWQSWWYAIVHNSVHVLELRIQSYTSAIHSVGTAVYHLITIV